MKKLLNLNYLLMLALTLFSVACSDDEIKRNPIADFSFKIAEDGVTVTFTNDSKDSKSYAWDFGDGQTSTEKEPVHEYAEDGTYDVKLVATGDGGKTDEFTQAVEIQSGGAVGVLTYELSWAVGDGYSGPALTFSEEDWEAISDVLGLSKEEVITGLDEGTVQVVAIEADGSINTETTASGFGQWFDADGNVANWADEGSRVYAEWHLGDNDNIQFGHRPDHPVAADDEYTVKQALVTDDEKQFSFTFNIAITE